MKVIRLLVISSLMVVAFGCSTVSVRCDYDTKADFASLKTFSFMPVQAEANINPLNVKRIQDAVRTQLEFKGNTMIPGNPDFLIAMHLTKKLKKLELDDRGYSFGSGSYWGTSFSREFEYEEGTLVLDFVDTQSKELIWRGVAVGEIYDDIGPEEQIKRINGITQEILSNFPPAK